MFTYTEGISKHIFQTATPPLLWYSVRYSKYVSGF